MLAVVALFVLAVSVRAADAAPRVFVWDAKALADAKGRVDGDLKPAFERLKADAEKALKAKPRSVMDKRLTAASGDKHDYMSVAPYFWPNPDTKDGLPYVRKDGQVNPERHNNDTDATALKDVTGAAQTLAVAYYFTGDERYAAHAAKLLRVWFLEPATRMNPNLNFAQAIPGVSAGRGIGIIDTVGFVGLVDAIGLLGGSKGWTAEDQKGMVAWIDAYLDWLQTSKNGKEEARAKNNHGTWYDAQVVAYALFVGKNDLAKQVAEAAKVKRIDSQIRSDGAMPLELERTNSLSYTLYNLNAFFNLARLAEHVGVDLWRHESPDGGSLRLALDYVAPYLDPTRKWQGQQISGKNGADTLGPLLRRGAIAYKEGSYEQLLRKHGGDGLAANRWQLLFPMQN
jgi:hypothetical protein